MNTEHYDHSEQGTQHEVIALLQQELGFVYKGSLRSGFHDCVLWDELGKYLNDVCHLTLLQREKVMDQIRDCINHTNASTLYQQNKEFYRLLMQGVPYPADGTRRDGRVHLVDFRGKNDFYIAEEVTVKRLGSDKETARPDLVVYVNGIALVVIELKRSAVSVADGIRQNYRNQQQSYIPQFFTTVQLVMAGNKSEGLRYGTIGTIEEFFLRWKEPVGIATPSLPPSQFTPQSHPNELYRSLLQMLQPQRLLEMVEYCVVFDKNKKKVARPNQWFALKAAQQRIISHDSGIIWHSQGAGKSLMMVFLARWIMDYDKQGRVLIITDREELDKQIFEKFGDVGLSAVRADSCSNLTNLLNTNTDQLICTLLHKFGVGGRGQSDEDTDEWRGLLKERNISKYLEAVTKRLPTDYSPKGNLYVFVDECHRTQGGGLHAAMRKLVGDKAMLIGFTGTPLLHNDKEKLSESVFGSFIHRYTFKEAVDDNVILDLRYEARNIQKEVRDEDTLNALYERLTRNLNETAKRKLTARWAKISRLYNSKDALQRVVFDIVRDMTLFPPLDQGYANAMLVAESQPSAYRYWKMFQETELKGHCAVVTSYDGSEPEVSEAFSDESPTEKQEMYETCKLMLAGQTHEAYETAVKERFVNDPADMKLLIVVNKLLTGFDAPACTYLYIDRPMHDHDLFQAVCRTNRTNGDLKDYGFIIDYRDLFENMQQTISDYTGAAFESFDKEDVDGLLKDTTEKDKQDFEKMRGELAAIEARVGEPYNEDAYFDFFCYNHNVTHAEAIKSELEKRTILRQDFYKKVTSLARAYTRLADRLTEENVGYTEQEVEQIKDELRHYDQLRHAVMLRSGDYVDMRRYDAHMRDLLDRYISAPRSEKLADFSDFSFLDIVKLVDGDKDVEIDQRIKDELGGEHGVADVMTANVRRVINSKSETETRYYTTFATELNKLIDRLHQKLIGYKDYLLQMALLIKRMREDEKKIPKELKSALSKKLFRLFEGDATLAKNVDEIVTDLRYDNEPISKLTMRDIRREVNKILPAEYDIDEVVSLIESNDYTN